MIKIFNSNDRNFSSNGNIAINAIKLVETKRKSLNGWFIDVVVPTEFEDDIRQDMLCVVQTKSKLRPQAFRIKNIKKNGSTISFQAEHVLFDSRDYFLVDVRPTDKSALAALEDVNSRVDRISPFSIISNVNSVSTAYFINKNLLEAFVVIEERWNGLFDADNFDISFKKSLGQDNGETITYGSDMQGIEIVEDWSNVVTRIYPTGPDGIMLPEKYLDANIEYPTPYTKKVSFESKLEEEETSLQDLLNELRINATNHLEVNQYPKVSYLVKSDVKQSLEIGDTVHVKHPLLNIVTEVQEYRYDINSKRVISIEFGNYSRDVKKKFDSIKEGIIEAKEKASTAEWLITKQTEIINSLNKNGFVYIDENEILILDKLPKESAKHVWRFGLGGIGFSQNGYEGPFEFAFTYDGYLNVAFINAGSITANKLAADVGSTLDLSSNVSIGLIVKDINMKTDAAFKVQQDSIDGVVRDLGGVSDRVATNKTSIDEISQTLSNINNNDNIIPYLNGSNELIFDDYGQPNYPYWIFEQDGLLPATDLHPGQDVFPADSKSPIFWQERIPGSLSEFGVVFDTVGKAITGEGYVVPDMPYSFSAKRFEGLQRFKVYTREYDSVGAKYDSPHTRKLLLDASTPKTKETATTVLDAATQAVRLEFEILTFDTLKLADMMFNRGDPKDYAQSATDAISHSKTTRIQLATSIEDQVKINGKVTAELLLNKDGINANATEISLKANKVDLMGYVTISDLANTGQTIINGSNITTGIIQANRINFNGATGTNMNITGKITTNDLLATGGKVGGYSIGANSLYGNKISLEPNLIKIGTAILIADEFYDNRLEIRASNLIIRNTVNGQPVYLGLMAKASNGTDILAGNVVSMTGGRVGVHTDDFETTNIKHPYSSDIRVQGNFVPWSNNQFTLGTSTYRNYAIYLGTQPNVGSDSRYKTHILPVDPVLIKHAHRLKARTYRLAHDKEGKIHFGYIAQDVETMIYNYMYEVNILSGNDRLTSSRNAQKEVTELALLHKSESYMSLLYGEIEVLKTAYIENKIENLENRIKLIEEVPNGSNRKKRASITRSEFRRTSNCERIVRKIRANRS